MLSLNVHFSNLPIALLSAVLIYCIARKNRIKLHIVAPAIALVFALLFGFIINKSIPGNNNAAGQMFLIARSLDTGALQSFLNDNCHSNTYQLCSIKDKLPSDSRTLLFDGASPLKQFGGWDADPKVYNEVLFGMLTSPKHLGILMYQGLLSTASQMLSLIHI